MYYENANLLFSISSFTIPSYDTTFMILISVSRLLSMQALLNDAGRSKIQSDCTQNKMVSDRSLVGNRLKLAASILRTIHQLRAQMLLNLSAQHEKAFKVCSTPLTLHFLK